MAMNLVEGQNFSAKYVLQKRMNESEFVDCWLATDAQTDEKIVLKIFKRSLSESEKVDVQNAIKRQKNLQYSFIVRSLEYLTFEDFTFTTSPYIQNAEPYLHQEDQQARHQGPFSQQWRLLRQVAKALEVAHSLGFAHGHIHPNNILITDDGNVHVTDFGLAQSKSASAQAYLSPQIIDDQPATPSDDIYSFGQLIHVAITGRPAGDKLAIDLPSEIEQLLKAMLHTSPMERPIGLSKTIELIDNFVAEFNSEVQQAVNTKVSTDSVHKLPREQNTVSTSKVIGAMALLITVTLIIFVLLPDAEPVIVPSTAIENLKVDKLQQDIPKKLAPFEIAKLKKLEEEGATLATRLLRLQLEVEDLGGQVWASADYNKSVELGIAGDDAYREQEYQGAFEQYQNGINLLESTLTSVDKIFSNNQQIGQIALGDGDALTALNAYTILTLIEPSNKEILSNLSRAENLDRVQSLIRDGEIHERNAELEEALALFKEAYDVDKKWPPASEALSRTKQKVANQNFNSEMSLAFSALNEGNFENAKLSFAKAQKILPQSFAPKDGLEQITIAVIQKKIDEHILSAKQYIVQEDWTKSAIEYEAILSIASGTTLATEGLTRSQFRQELNTELDKFISKPDLMVTDDALNEAKAILINAFKIEASGQKLQDQISQLSHLVSLARIPINVELVSDNKTEVTVYKIRSFGQLDSVMLPLYPGTYTFVGKRRGYRDIHKEVTLQGGRPAPSIMISCVERI
ncbi:MAG: serine/threonine protein kinase [Flavobacterium sp.]|jgi:serine/threonine protein kinase